VKQRLQISLEQDKRHQAAKKQTNNKQKTLN